tara:strand:- start:664 stop:924 length:261 start_codon:yes stop_codon:yes gene_type:complete
MFSRSKIKKAPPVNPDEKRKMDEARLALSKNIAYHKFVIGGIKERIAELEETILDADGLDFAEREVVRQNRIHLKEFLAAIERLVR